jgi:hypothetical integral membrane protein (TIGR02206 family)
MTDPVPFSTTPLFSLAFIAATAFRTFDGQHLVTLAIITISSILLFSAARKSGAAGRGMLGRSMALILLSYAAVFFYRQAAAYGFDWAYSLPLDICSLVLIACLVSLLRPCRFMTEIAYYWGMGGVVQATITPDITRGFPSWEFMLFFWGHGATLLAIVFLISAKDFVPRRNSVVRMMIALNIYALVVGSINAVMGWNYGYLSAKPAMPSLLDYLGPWPWYLLSLEVIALVLFLLLDIPWRIAERRRRLNARPGAAG